MDHLNLRQDPVIPKKILVDKQNEQITYSCKINKYYKDKNKQHERIFLLTNQAIYHLKGPHSLSRVTKLENIEAITISSKGPEFILHITGEYDFRYNSKEHKSNIIEAIQKDIPKDVKVYYRHETDLQNYTFNKNEAKKNDFGKVQSRNSQQPDKIFVPFLKNLSNMDSKINLQAFKLINILGKGAFGTVYLAQNKSNMEYYALKALNKSEITDYKSEKQLKIERHILENSDSPFLVKSHYTFQSESKIYLALDFKKGGELFQHLAKFNQFTEKQTKFYAAQIILALENLHNKQIIYRDLKPENILLDEFGNICITDFGMSAIIQHEGLKQYSLVGSVQYISPEIVKGKGHTYSTDFWSLGIILYEMIFGKPPFYSPNQSIIFNLIVNQPLKFYDLPNISAELKDFIILLLNKDPEQRPSLENIKKHAWFSDTDFQKVQNRDIVPPYIPQIVGDSWLNNFEKFEDDDLLVENQEKK